jgi:tRNA pseudouridine38-40 synthase
MVDSGTHVAIFAHPNSMNEVKLWLSLRVPRYFVELSYKGSAYHGWQIQPNAVTVQECLNKALSTVTRQSIETIGCGRTDTGVHASIFFAHVDLNLPIEATGQLVFQLNALLARDIRVRAIHPVADTAHARFDATLRSYGYYIFRQPGPFLQGLGWNFSRTLDLEAMNQAASLCLSHTDFSCFGKSGGQQHTTLCRVTECHWESAGNTLVFTVSANRFLRGMVRAMVGSFIEIGEHKSTLEDFLNLLNQPNRGLAGESVPPEGLFLEEIRYPYLPDQRISPFHL